MMDLSLFDTPDTWLTAPLEAFAAWLVSDQFAVNKQGEPQELRGSTAKVYLSMFRAFVQQVLLDDTGALKKTLAQLEQEDIRSFLDGRQLTGSIRHRYVRLLERIFDMLTVKGVVTSNPGKGLAVKQPRASKQGDDQTVWLTPEQTTAVVASLEPEEGESWKEARNKTMQALVLGGGLKVSEIIELRLTQVGTARQTDSSIYVDVRPTGAGMWHRTRVAAFAASKVLSWLEIRKSLPIQGELVFPAGQGGGTLHPATVYRHTAAVLSAAGINSRDVKRRGARTLRNTYAMTELASGNPANLVGHHLGHRSDRGTRYYTELLAKQLKL